MKLTILTMGLTGLLALVPMASVAVDTDGDGLTDDVETSVGLDPFDATDFFNDSDGDGVYDGEEVLDGTDFNDASSFVDMLDRSINQAGVMTFPFITSSDFNDIRVETTAVNSSGNVFMAGELDGDETTFYLAKWNSDWTLDTEFSTDGFLLGSDFSFDGEYVKQIEIQPSQQPLLLVNECVDNACLVAIDETGQLDTEQYSSQTTPGVFEFDVRPSFLSQTINLDSGERFYAYQVSNFDQTIRVVKITQNEQIDSSFNNDTGYLELNIVSSPTGSASEYVTGVWSSHDGDLLLGVRTNEYAIYLVKFDVNGELDVNWGEQGVLQIETGSDSEYRNFKLIVDDESGYWLQTFLEPAGDSAVEGVTILRLTDSGERDTTFADNGEFIFANHSGVTYDPLTFEVQNDGTIISASAINIGLSSPGAVAFRLTEFGQLDTRFYNNGIARFSLGDDVLTISSALILNNHDVAIVGPYQPTDGAIGTYAVVIPNESDIDGDGIEDYADPVDDRQDDNSSDDNTEDDSNASENSNETEGETTSNNSNETETETETESETNSNNSNQQETTPPNQNPNTSTNTSDQETLESNQSETTDEVEENIAEPERSSGGSLSWWFVATIILVVRKRYT